MNRFLKIILIVTGAVLLLGIGLFALKGDEIKRLSAVNTMFDADKIVDNFSHMDRGFLVRLLDVPISDELTTETVSIPETVDIAGTERPLADVLAELDTTSLVILRDGKIIHESYYLGTGPDDRRISWSVAKSFMSGLYGNALADGDIASLDDEVTTYVPELKGTAYEGATLRNILNMSSGIRYNEDYLDQQSDINKMGRTIALGGSLDDYTTTLKDRQFEPGTDWQYVSMDTHVAAWALRKATGRTLHDLWEETYGPLGFRQQPYYMVDGKDVAFALGGLNLTTRDYAKFGQLFLQMGEWEGEQLIPADWVARSTVHSAPAVSDRGVGYGYQWWVPMPADQDYFAVGIYGQYIYIDPKTNIVIAKNAADREFMFADEVGTHSINKNIELMRSLAAQLGEREDGL
jgi:CubicO group peptidase (beta-lactamase class C family)